MPYRIVAALIAVGMALAGLATAGQFNKKLSAGDPAPVWTDLPGTDGKKHSLADFKGKEVIVLVFTCNSCPIAVAYEDRIIALAKKYSANPKVAVVAINVNTIAEDRLDKMTERAKEKNFPFPYLYDETQKIAHDYGAKYTPEFFVLDKDRKVAYLGALDDKNKAADAKVSYLDAAIVALLKGEKPSPAETLGRGCMIRYKRK